MARENIGKILGSLYGEKRFGYIKMRFVLAINELMHFEVKGSGIFDFWNGIWVTRPNTY